MEKLETVKRYEIGKRATDALVAAKYDTRPGWCQRWVKQVLLSIGVSPAMAVDGSGSARIAFERYEALGMVMPVGTKANIGDLLYKVRAVDGKAGHVGIYVGRGVVAENSSAHWSGAHPDARGMRDLSAFPKYRVVRLWKS